MPITLEQAARRYGDDILARQPLVTLLTISDLDEGYNTETEIGNLVVVWQRAAAVSGAGNAEPKAGARRPTVANVIAELTVKSQELIAWGAGGLIEPATLQYPAAIFVHKGAAPFSNDGFDGGFYDGEITLQISNRDGSFQPQVRRLDTRTLRSADPYAANKLAGEYVEADRNRLRQPLPMTPLLGIEGDRLQVRFKCVAMPLRGDGNAAVAVETADVKPDSIYLSLPISRLSV